MSEPRVGPPRCRACGGLIDSYRLTDRRCDRCAVRHLTSQLVAATERAAAYKELAEARAGIVGGAHPAASRERVRVAAARVAALPAEEEC